MQPHDPRDMLLFVKVAEFGSMSAAARSLGKPKASVSRAISRLEHLLGARLLERSNRRVALTETGSVFLRHCQRVAEEIEEAVAVVGALQGTVRGLLRIATPVTFGRSLLWPALPAFLDAYPELRMELELTHRSIDPIEEGFDLIVRYGPLAPSSLVAKLLGEAPYGVFAARSYLKRHPPITVPADLARHGVLDFFGQEQPHVWGFARGTESARVAVTPRVNINDAVLRKEAVIAGVGISLLPLWLCERELRDKQLVSVLPDWTPRHLPTIYALWPSRRNPSPRLRAFLSFLADTVHRRLTPAAPVRGRSSRRTRTA